MLRNSNHVEWLRISHASTCTELWTLMRLCWKAEPESDNRQQLIFQTPSRIRLSRFGWIVSDPLSCERISWQRISYFACSLDARRQTHMTLKLTHNLEPPSHPEHEVSQMVSLSLNHRDLLVKSVFYSTWYFSRLHHLCIGWLAARDTSSWGIAETLSILSDNTAHGSDSRIGGASVI